jgi:hypothetical protein
MKEQEKKWSSFQLMKFLRDRIPRSINYLQINDKLLILNLFSYHLKTDESGQLNCKGMTAEY